MAGLLIITAGSTAHAASVYGQPTTLTGERSVGNGLEIIEATKPGAVGDWSNGSVKWEITIDGLEVHYKYIFKDFIGPPAISHIAIDLTDDAVNDPDAVTNVKVNGVDVDPSDLEFGNVENIIGGVKIDEGDPETLDNKVIYTFTSNRLPVWGDISIEAGQEQAPTHFLVQNTGFGDQTLSDTTEYVARPNSVIPTPSAAAAGLALLCGLMLRRRGVAR